ncbi:MAG TPA: HAMP domain-containing sensor histidine kinase [Nitriliruptorales bacterium]
MRPLDRIGSIKLKLGIAIVIAVAVSATVSTIGLRLGVPIWLRPVIAAALALMLVQILARGMTSPLREMAAAARRMADGDWDQRVTDTSADEVGELARAFNGMAHELAAVDRMRKDLVANVSHELRTPISALGARLENLVDGVDDPSPELFRAMLEQTTRLGRLVDQLLDLSRLESGAVPLRHEFFDVQTMLESVAAEAQLQAPDRRIRVTGVSGVELRADPDRIHQILANLVTNALEHAPGSPVELAAEADATAVVLCVADEGPGIADPDRVFERFYRTDGSRAVPGGGAGLGLAIALWIVELHGGDIEVRNVQPHGCRVLVRIPREATSQG